MLAHDLLLAGSATVDAAGGMESMTNAPYLLDRARCGYRMGHGRILDHMFLDGLEDAYDKGRLMGTFAEDCAQSYRFPREAQDEYAITSLTRAQQATADGVRAEIVPVTVKTAKLEREVVHDELPVKATPIKIPHLKPAFREGGTVTAANSSAISDGPPHSSHAQVRSRTPRPRTSPHHRRPRDLRAYTRRSFPLHPLAPSAGSSAHRLVAYRVDLFEINEAFAVVAMAAMRDLNLPHEKVNVHGGASALGHPIGASGARIIVTLLAALKKYGLGAESLRSASAAEKPPLSPSSASPREIRSIAFSAFTRPPAPLRRSLSASGFSSLIAAFSTGT